MRVQRQFGVSGLADFTYQLRAFERHSNPSRDDADEYDDSQKRIVLRRARPAIHESWFFPCVRSCWCVWSSSLWVEE